MEARQLTLQRVIALLLSHKPERRGPKRFTDRVLFMFKCHLTAHYLKLRTYIHLSYFYLNYSLVIQWNFKKTWKIIYFLLIYSIIKTSKQEYCYLSFEIFQTSEACCFLFFCVSSILPSLARYPSSHISTYPPIHLFISLSI